MTTAIHHKASIAPVRLNGPMTRESIKEIYEERAAIVQFDGGLSRQAAERAALGEMVSRYGASVRPAILGSEIPQALRSIRGVCLASEMSARPLAAK